MADKPTKQKTKKATAPASVLGSLPATRPERLGRPRGGTAAPASAPRAAAARPRSTGTASTATRPERATSTATRSRPATSSAPRSRFKASAAEPNGHGPAAVTPASPPLECHARPEGSAEATPIGVPRGTEFVTTAIRATGELAQIGFSVGGRALKRAVARLPHP